MKTLFKAAALMIACMFVFFLFASYGMFEFFAPIESGNKEMTKKITINHGESVKAIALKLKKEDLIRTGWSFEASARFLGSSLKVGEYILSSNMSTFEIAHLLSKGVKKQEQELTLIEGWNTSDMAGYLEQQKFSSKGEFLNIVRRAELDEQYPILSDKPHTESLEGYLFPDTYRVFVGSTIRDLVVKMLENLERKYTKTMREDTKKRGMTIFKLLTLASIVEREVQTDEDRGRVADIFYRRLSIGMPLQSDATVNYVTGKRALQPTFTDLEANSPYNTYKYRGLPPGPISNPGLSSIKASIYPIPNTYLYFLTTPEGKVIYSNTYNEHLAAKRKYLSH